MQLLINPTAGNGEAQKVGELAHAYLQTKQVEHELVFTQYSGHATELAKEAAERGIATVIAVGGDGTICETAAGLMHSGCALGILPAGTGNDFVKAVGIPRQWKDGLDFILSHPARAIDTGIMNDTFFMNVCGVGFDVMVLDYALIAKKYCKGLLPYLYGVIRAIKNFKPFPMHVEIGDDVKLDGSYLICSIANGRFFGGGIPIAPIADVADGLFDILVVDAQPRWKIPFYLPALLSGKLMNYPFSHHYRASAAAVSAPGMRLNRDGEIIQVEEVRFRCERDALKIHW